MRGRQWQFATSGPATWLTLAVLVLATIASRLPLLAPRLAHWDAVNYALGLHTFDIAAHQPHPPGSPYFILLGRAALALLGDDNAALELISVLASAGAVMAVYLLAKLLFGRREADHRDRQEGGQGRYAEQGRDPREDLDRAGRP